MSGFAPLIRNLRAGSPLTNSLINDMIQRKEHQKQERKHGTGMDR
ncbi:MAG: hypothetical protein QTN59_09715 [Candidatus Electrothrix communis]|nr:MAG: hypothetical protein QTN59_09715 [Candidatus Electrothrix communis]